MSDSKRERPPGVARTGRASATRKGKALAHATSATRRGRAAGPVFALKDRSPWVLHHAVHSPPRPAPVAPMTGGTGPEPGRCTPGREWGRWNTGRPACCSRGTGPGLAVVPARRARGRTNTRLVGSPGGRRGGGGRPCRRAGGGFASPGCACRSARGRGTAASVTNVGRVPRPARSPTAARLDAGRRNVEPSPYAGSRPVLPEAFAATGDTGTNRRPGGESRDRQGASLARRDRAGGAGEGPAAPRVRRAPPALPAPRGTHERFGTGTVLGRRTHWQSQCHPDHQGVVGTHQCHPPYQCHPPNALPSGPRWTHAPTMDEPLAGGATALVVWRARPFAQRSAGGGVGFGRPAPGQSIRPRAMRTSLTSGRRSFNHASNSSCRSITCGGYLS